MSDHHEYAGYTSGLALSVILPIRNEEEILSEASHQFAQHLDAIVGRGRWQYVFVENGSTDRSLEIIGKLIKKWPGSKSLSLQQSNYGNALREGLLASDGDWAFILNIDHLWDTPYFRWGWSRRENYDLILGSKRADPTLNGQDQYRRILSAVLNGLLQYLFDFVAADSHGMKLLRLETLRPIAESCIMRRGQFDTELTLRALRGGLRVAEIPVPYEEKRSPRNFMISKISWNIRDLFRLRKVMASVPYTGPVRYHRFCRYDLDPEEMPRDKMR